MKDLIITIVTALDHFGILKNAAMYVVMVILAYGFFVGIIMGLFLIHLIFQQ